MIDDYQFERSTDNLQLPCVQPPTSSYNFQLAMVIMVAMVMVVMVVMVVVVVVVVAVVAVNRTGQDRQNHSSL